jgi:hypothetical protein
MKLLTKDLYEAAYLKAKGMKLAKVMQSRNSVLLEFEGGGDLDVLKSKYREGRAEVNVLKLKDEMREVKDIVFSLMRSAKAEGKEMSLSFI